MTPDTSAEVARATRPALRNGLRQRCPGCGQGRLFTRYLRVADSCESCGEALHHHRADDIPAYLTILIVAHLVGFALPIGFDYLADSPVLLGVMLCSAVLALTLLMLPAVKGLVVAYQWANRMHGFGHSML